VRLSIPSAERATARQKSGERSRESDDDDDDDGDDDDDDHGDDGDDDDDDDEDDDDGGGDSPPQPSPPNDRRERTRIEPIRLRARSYSCAGAAALPRHFSCSASCTAR
jgi:hypothetical protein